MIIGHGIGHNKLFDVLFVYLDAIHPHASFFGEGLLDVNQAALSLLHEVVHHFGYLYLGVRVWLLMLLLLGRDLMNHGVSLLVAEFCFRVGGTS